MPDVPKLLLAAEAHYQQTVKNTPGDYLALTLAASLLVIATCLADWRYPEARS